MVFFVIVVVVVVLGNAFRNIQHMGRKLYYFVSTLKLFKYPSKTLFYCTIVCLRTIIIVYFITMIGTIRNEKLLTEQVINTHQMGFMSNRVGYNHLRLFAVMTKKLL